MPLNRIGCLSNDFIPRSLIKFELWRAWFYPSSRLAWIYTPELRLNICSCSQPLARSQPVLHSIVSYFQRSMAPAIYSNIAQLESRLKVKEASEVVFLADRYALGSQDRISRVKVEKEVGQAMAQHRILGRGLMCLPERRPNLDVSFTHFTNSTAPA
jgi:hypothetical protein